VIKGEYCSRKELRDTVKEVTPDVLSAVLNFLSVVWRWNVS